MRCRAAGVLILVTLASCAGDDAGTTATPVERPDRVVDEFRLTETTAGVPQWRLRADEAQHFVTEAHTKLTGVELEFFTGDGDVRSRLTSLRGRVEDATSDMIAEGTVLLVSSDGDSLETEYLRYNKETNDISGPGFVRIAKPDRVLTGIGFRAKPDLTQYEVEKDVRIRLVDRNDRSTGP